MKFFIGHDFPGGSFLIAYLFRIINNTGNTPHISCCVFTPGFTVDFIGFKGISDKGRNPFDIVIFLNGFIKKFFRKRNEHIFGHQLHNHILGRTYDIIFIPQRQHIVKFFVGTKAAVFNLYFLMIGVIIPLFEIFIHRIFTDDVFFGKRNGFIFSPAAFINIFFPVADTKGNHIIIFCHHAFQSVLISSHTG